MKNLILLAGLLASVFFGCRRSAEPQHQHAAQTVGPAVAVTLNSGEKWPANRETTDGITTMKQLVAALPAEATPEDYGALRTRLEAEFTSILQKCTMTGEEHEQLHHYLEPMQEIIKELSSEDPALASDAAKRLEQHLDAYQNYFR